MRQLHFIICSIFILITPIYSCPIDGQDKEELLIELCNIDDGKWESNRLNEMIILTKYERLPSEATKNGNRILAALTCRFKEFKY